jgi:DNA-binding response OmpR family regulator
MRMLIVEDESVVANHLKNTLAKNKDTVHVAINGEDAIKMIKDTVYDVILLDYHLPGKSGLEVMNAAKEISPKTRIIMLTGYPFMKETIAKFAGVDDYLQKPLDIEEIQAAIDKYRPEFT